MGVEPPKLQAERGQAAEHCCASQPAFPYAMDLFFTQKTRFPRPSASYTGYAFKVAASE